MSLFQRVDQGLRSRRWKGATEGDGESHADGHPLLRIRWDGCDHGSYTYRRLEAVHRGDQIPERERARDSVGLERIPHSQLCR